MNNARILIVEDEKIVAIDIRNMLKKIGYDVPATVSSGEEAIQKASKIQPDLVLMDIMLKGEIDGIEASEQIALKFRIPVIYLTAYADEKTLQRAKITEPYGYILKPFHEKELHTTIEMALYKHKMEKKIRENERWLYTTLRSIGDAVITTDADGNITFMNPVAESLTGWKQEEATDKPLNAVFKIVNAETGDEAENPVEKVIREGRTVGLDSNTLLINKDGDRIPIEDSSSPIMAEADSGELIGVVLVFHDITQRRRMEAELMRMEKLASLEVLAGGIAHDFNNILTPIIGNISLAKIYDDPDKVTERLEESEKAAMLARDLTQQLLAFSRGGASVKEPANITELLMQTAKFALRGSGSKCEFSISDEPWTVEIDQSQISQVINNLIINADQAMPEGGTVSIGVENITLENKASLPVKAGRYVKITVRDQGIGIPKEHLKRIFDPYFTTKQKGSGLGLATSYSIIRNHDGHIAAESDPGEGSTFSIYLPASGEPAPPKSNNENSMPVMGKGRVLVMDDEESIRELAGEMLKSMGYEATTAADGAEALKIYEAAKTSERSYDAVIMDLTIPGGMGAKKAIKSFKEIDPEVRAIACSGYSNDPVMANFEEYGFRSAITKPYKVSALSQVLNEVIRREPRHQ